MTETSSKGLLPQLVEVLQTLASSQGLLTEKVRNARLEGTGIGSPASAPSLVPAHAALDEEPPVAPIPERVVSDPPPLLDQPEPMQNRVDPAAQATMYAASTSMPPDAAAPIAFAEPRDAATLPDAPRKMGHPVVPEQSDASTPPPNHPTGTEFARPRGADDDHTNRNYNFFDELDARLSDLSVPDRTSEATENGTAVISGGHEPP